MWDVEKLKESRPFVPAHTAAITQLNLDSFSNYILSSSFDGTVRSWNMEVWLPISTFRGVASPGGGMGRCAAAGAGKHSRSVRG